MDKGKNDARRGRDAGKREEEEDARRKARGSREEGNEGRNERDRKARERDPYDCWHQAVCSAHLAIPASNASLPRLPARHLTRSRTFTNTYEAYVHILAHFDSACVQWCVHTTTMSLAVAPEESRSLLTTLPTTDIQLRTNIPAVSFVEHVFTE